MLPIILAATVLGSVAPAPPEPPRQDPAIRVWLNKRGYVDRMDRVRAYVRTNVDGYVVILHAEPSGRVRVLFPLDPDDDAFVRAGRDYEIRSRGDREAFTVYDGGGPGVVLAAVSQDPLHFDALALNRHWDYRVAGFTVGDDPEADLLALVQQMTGGAWFDYDVARYEVATPYSIASGGDDATVHLSFYTTPYYGHYWSGGAGFTIGFGWYDPWYDPFYSPCWDYWYCGYDAWWRYPYYASPYYPVAYYPVGYYAPRYFVPGSSRIRHVFPGGWGGYAFKSYDDRFGLQPRSVEMRRRTTVANTNAATRSVVSPASSGRRAASPASARPAQGTAGSLEARRRYGTAADGSTKLPSIFGRRPTAASGATTAPTRAGGAATSGRRTTTPATAPRNPGTVGRTTPAGGGVRRTTGNQAGTPSGMRPVTPRTVTPASPAGTRSPAGTVGSGRTVKPSSGTLERRTPTRGSSVPATRAPARSTRPATRSVPSRPPARVSRPPARTSRPPARTSRPPARTSRPPARTSRPPARTSRPPARARGRGGH
jgi:hypothetical protein